MEDFSRVSSIQQSVAREQGMYPKRTNRSPQAITTKKMHPTPSQKRKPAHHIASSSVTLPTKKPVITTPFVRSKDLRKSRVKPLYAWE
eukprot:CAMPEP_0117453030 /NCGR_PEP_ID=MMETSP0759-20121206/9976_1 /TAXON_ID=63605 /ORGANISM="Percolomonas cosmopolitus, Strain WS" /LENGTH=87 /DNA_ID=CAMNT_0005245975 /DNA_START=465 /DNA_END=725 /DNA_ORIENTATION=+